MIPNTTLTSKCCQPFTFPHGRSPHYTFVYTFTRRVLCQISAATKLTLTQYQLGSHTRSSDICHVMEDRCTSKSSDNITIRISAHSCNCQLNNSECDRLPFCTVVLVNIARGYHGGSFFDMVALSCFVISTIRTSRH